MNKERDQLQDEWQRYCKRRDLYKTLIGGFFISVVIIAIVFMAFTMWEKPPVVTIDIPGEGHGSTPDIMMTCNIQLVSGTWQIPMSEIEKTTNTITVSRDGRTFVFLRESLFVCEEKGDDAEQQSTEGQATPERDDRTVNPPAI